jgi:hypothetical protein
LNQCYYLGLSVSSINYPILALFNSQFFQVLTLKLNFDIKEKIIVKVNVLKIILAHGNTLVDARTKRPGWDDWVTFVIVPTAFALMANRCGLSLGTNALTIIITALSIFVGLLFNMVVLVFDILKRDSTNKLKNNLLKQLLANISFTILLSIVIIALSLISRVKEPTIKMLADFIIYFSLSFFFVTLVMILKRMYGLYDNEMKEIERRASVKADAEEIEMND